MSCAMETWSLKPLAHQGSPISIFSLCHPQYAGYFLDITIHLLQETLHKLISEISKHLFFSQVFFLEVKRLVDFFNDGWRGCGENGTLLHCWWEYKLVQLPWKTLWRFIRKLKIELLYDPIISLLAI